MDLCQVDCFITIKLPTLILTAIITAIAITVTTITVIKAIAQLNELCHRVSIFCQSNLDADSKRNEKPV